MSEPRKLDLKNARQWFDRATTDAEQVRVATEHRSHHPGFDPIGLGYEITPTTIYHAATFLITAPQPTGPGPRTAKRSKFDWSFMGGYLMGVGVHGLFTFDNTSGLVSAITVLVVGIAIIGYKTWKELTA
jgi:hypothetical protein